MRAKLHDIRITGCMLEYSGSITLDPELCRTAGIYPLEFVHIWNKNSGQRISTYVIYGEPGSKCCILNGAAARTCCQGDAVIVCAYEYIDKPEDLYAKTPSILLFDAENNIRKRLRYVIDGQERGRFDFSAVSEDV
jgi:aspartate 1-decarboxylase